MDDSPFATGHGVKLERPAGPLDLFGGGQGAEAEFFNPQRTIVVGVETKPAVVFGRHAEHLHGEVLEGEQQFRPVGKQQFYIRTGEAHHNLRVLEVRVRVFRCGYLVLQPQAGTGQQRRKKPPDAGADGIHGVLGSIHGYFFAVFLRLEAGGGATTGAGMVLLKNHCWPIATRLLVSQYNTRPLETP